MLSTQSLGLSLPASCLAILDVLSFSLCHRPLLRSPLVPYSSPLPATVPRSPPSSTTCFTQRNSTEFIAPLSLPSLSSLILSYPAPCLSSLLHPPSRRAKIPAFLRQLLDSKRVQEAVGAFSCDSAAQGSGQLNRQQEEEKRAGELLSHAAAVAKAVGLQETALLAAVEGKEESEAAVKRFLKVKYGFHYLCALLL